MYPMRIQDVPSISRNALLSFENLINRHMSHSNDSFSLFSEFKVDVEETDNSSVITIVAPGLSKDNFDITIEDNLLCVKTEETEESNNSKYFKKYEKRFKLPKNVMKDEIECSYVNGILKLSLNYIPEEKREIKKIEVK